MFTVNGARVFLIGGNWITTDQLLRYAADTERYFREVRLHRDAGLNLIRVWGGGIAERDKFYDAADELGVLVMQEFWMTGDNNGRWGGSADYPADRPTYISNVRDTVLRLRGRPSLLLLCGGNELWPPDKSPPPDVLSDERRLVKELGKGTVIFVPSSMGALPFDPEYALAPQDGPYGMLHPRQFFERNPGLYSPNGTRLDATPVAFQPEIGSTSAPWPETLQLMSPDPGVFPACGAPFDAVPAIWQYHMFEPFVTRDEEGVYDHVCAYGAPRNASEWALRAQLAQYQQYKALFEGFASHMWEWYSAVLLWKSQSPWPALRGGLYDHLLEPNGGYFGVRAALADPVHVHVDLRDGVPVVVNRSPVAVRAGSAVVTELRALDGTLAAPPRRQSVPEDVAPNSAARMRVPLEWPASVGPGRVLLVRTLLLGRANDTIAEDRTWLSDPSLLRQDYRELEARRTHGPHEAVEIAASARVAADGGSVRGEATVRNAGTGVAFFVRLQLLRAEGPPGADRRVLPTRWQANCLFLLPGEEVSVEFEGVRPSPPLPLAVGVAGWNVPAAEAPVTWL